MDRSARRDRSIDCRSLDGNKSRDLGSFVKVSSRVTPNITKPSMHNHSNNILNDIRKRIDVMQDKIRHTEPKNYTTSHNRMYNGHRSPSDITPPVYGLKEESHILDVPKDVSAIELKTDNDNNIYMNKPYMEPERNTKSNYKAYDALFEPMAKNETTAPKTDNLPKTESHIAPSKKTIIPDVPIPFSYKNEDNRNEKDTFNMNVNSIPSTVDIKPEKSNNNYLFDKSMKSSDYEVQSVTTNIIQKKTKDEVVIDRMPGYSQAITVVGLDLQPVPPKQRPHLQTTEAKRMVVQRTHNYTISLTRSILSNFKKHRTIKQAKNYNYTQKQKPIVNEPDIHKRCNDAEETTRKLREDLFRKDSEMASLTNTINNSKKEIENLKEELNIAKFEGSSAVSNYRRAAERIDELNAQLDAARLRLQSTSDKFGKLIDYIYRLNNPNYLTVLEDIVGGKGRNDLDDVYKKYDNLKRNMAEVTDLMYMSRDRTLIDKLEEINKFK